MSAGLQLIDLFMKQIKTWSMPAADGKRAFLPCALCESAADLSGAGDEDDAVKKAEAVFKPALYCEGFLFVKCKNCGLVQRNPQPLKEEITLRYSKTFGADYLKYEIDNEASFFKLQELALKDAGFFDLEKKLFSCVNDKNETPSVLDIGCATGSVLERLRANGWRVTGVEISPSAEYAVKTKGLDVRNLPLEDNKFPSNYFDVVLASHLIEHLNDPRGFLQETRRILKDGGYIFVTTPDISGFQSRLFGSRWRSAIFDHLYLFSKRTLIKLLKKTGFTAEICRTWGGLAAGTAPKWLKKFMDYIVKIFNTGDVMIIRARKNSRA